MAEGVLQARRRLGPDFGIHYLFREGVRQGIKKAGAVGYAAYNYYNRETETPKMASVFRNKARAGGRKGRRFRRVQRLRKRFPVRRGRGRGRRGKALKSSAGRAVRKNTSRMKVGVFKRNNNQIKVYDYKDLGTLVQPGYLSGGTFGAFEARVDYFDKINELLGNPSANITYHEYKIEKAWYKFTPLNSIKIMNSTTYQRPRIFYEGMAVWPRQHDGPLPTTMTEDQLIRGQGFKIVPFRKHKATMMNTAAYLDVQENAVADVAGTIYKVDNPLTRGRKWLEFVNPAGPGVYSNPMFFQMGYYIPEAGSTALSKDLQSWQVTLHVCVSLRNNNELFNEV